MSIVPSASSLPWSKGGPGAVQEPWTQWLHRLLLCLCFLLPKGRMGWAISKGRAAGRGAAGLCMNVEGTFIRSAAAPSPSLLLEQEFSLGQTMAAAALLLGAWVRFALGKMLWAGAESRLRALSRVTACPGTVCWEMGRGEISTKNARAAWFCREVSQLPRSQVPLPPRVDVQVGQYCPWRGGR